MRTLDPIAVLLQDLQALACIVGVFSRDGSLLADPWIICERPEQLALTLADAQDALVGAGPAGYHVLSGQVDSSEDAQVRATVLRPERLGPFPQGSAETLERALTTQFDKPLVQKLLRKSRNAPLQRRSIPTMAVYILDRNLVIESRWTVSGASSRAIEYPEGSLRPHLAVPMRARQAAWNWENVDLCAPFALSPVPGIILHAYPLRRVAGGVGTLVMVEHLEVRYTIQRFRAAHGLSARECEVIAHMLEGSTMSDIAEALSIAESTVQYHVKNAMAKAGARNRMHLAARVLGWDFGALGGPRKGSAD